MSSWLADRRLRRVQQRLTRARDRLAATEAEAALFSEQSEEDSLRSLVNDDGVARAEASESDKHASAARRSLAALRDEIHALERQRDELLDRRGR
ncbi:MAG: hypothetical protein ACLGHT_01445 [Acidimicrobiia bacterium]